MSIVDHIRALVRSGGVREPDEGIEHRIQVLVAAHDSGDLIATMEAAFWLGQHVRSPSQAKVIADGIAKQEADRSRRLSRIEKSDGLEIYEDCHRYAERQWAISHGQASARQLAHAFMESRGFDPIDRDAALADKLRKSLSGKMKLMKHIAAQALEKGADPPFPGW